MVNRVCPSFYGTRQQDEGVLLLFLLTLLALAQGKRPPPLPSLLPPLTTTIAKYYVPQKVC